MEEGSSAGRPKRLKRDSSYKAKAFEKFKQLKSGSKNKYEIEELENVYETVDEKEYAKTVLARQDDDWIVDDGTGYVEDGRDVFDDDLDYESVAATAASSKGKGIKRKKKGVAENAGKGNLHYLLSNIPAKKKKDDKMEDTTLAELLNEIDETPLNKPKLVLSDFSSVKKAEKEYVNSLNSLKTAIIQTPLKKTDIVENLNENIVLPQTSSQIVVESEPVSDSTQSCLLEDTLNDDLDMSEISVEVSSNSLENMEETFRKATVAMQSVPIEVSDFGNSEQLPLTDTEDGKVFRLFWWDAFEDASIQAGMVFLFGKTYHEEAKGFVSCCVVVRNIQRRIFFLPREKDENGEVITPQDVYKEINESVMKKMNVREFKAKPVTKKYAFDPEIPGESDYVEVRYSAQDPPIQKSLQGRTFSRVFGAESSFLEMLLLDRKIKGPSWLDISNASVVKNPLTWCKLEIDCHNVADIKIPQNVSTARPPLVVTCINMRSVNNSKTGVSEIVMLSCITNASYSVDKPNPNQDLFQNNFCLFTNPSNQTFPMDLFHAMEKYKMTTLQKLHGEKGVLNCFLAHMEKLDSDLIVGHDLQGYQMSLLSQRLQFHQIRLFSKLGRIKRRDPKNLDKSLFLGRLVCDVKTSAKELINCRSYDLSNLCQSVLKVPEEERIDLEQEDILKMYQTSSDILKLISLTMQDTVYILKLMYHLNIVPLALQITNISGNVMSRTLMGGRSERNEFLLLHAFSEKNFIVPDKSVAARNSNKKKSSSSYSGGLVLDPKIGFYDKFILLMDFNSLYPSIIQEYNLCFTTMAPNLSDERMVVPDKSLPMGILPTEIRKLVDSRREVKKLLINSPELSNDLKMQYQIRQMALKLTANSMYGCLGFNNSRFYAKNLAALITYKGREILTNTKEIVERMNYDVIYGDTDSLMINSNIIDYDQVFQIGTKIKQEINKLYKQIELDIDGVFKYLLLLKKKKYAAVLLTKDLKTNTLRTELEFKGLDIVRRDWSKLAAEAGKFALNEILSDQQQQQPFDERINNIFTHLRKVREDLEAGTVPLSLLVITKQLTKHPTQYPSSINLPHVQVALRFNKKSGGHYRAGDTVSYLICEDGTFNVATQRAYHIEELKNSSTLKIDVKYYLSQQIYPVVSRICEPIPEIALAQLADCLGVEVASSRTTKDQTNIEPPPPPQEEIKFVGIDDFNFYCGSCKFRNELSGGPIINNIAVLDKCQNPKCAIKLADRMPYIQKQLIFAIKRYIRRYYTNGMCCEDPACTYLTERVPVACAGRYSICSACENAVLLQKYTATQLFTQLSYFQHCFDLDRVDKKPLLEPQVEKAYKKMKNTVDKFIERSRFSVVELTDTYSSLTVSNDIMEY